MLISGARMDIVGVNLETKNLVLRKREKIKKKNSFKLRIESVLIGKIINIEYKKIS